MSWEQQVADESAARMFDLSAFPLSRVPFDAELDPDSNAGEAFLRTTGWSHRVKTWYLYFRRIDLQGRPRNRWSLGVGGDILWRETMTVCRAGRLVMRNPAVPCRGRGHTVVRAPLRWRAMMVATLLAAGALPAPAEHLLDIIPASLTISRPTSRGILGRQLRQRRLAVVDAEGPAASRFLRRSHSAAAGGARHAGGVGVPAGDRVRLRQLGPPRRPAQSACGS